MDYLKTLDSPVGGITLASDGEAIIGLWFAGQKHFQATLGPAQSSPDMPALVSAHRWLERYFEGVDPGAALSVNPRGTAFQQAVWQQLAQIPYGQVTTYGAVARRMEAETGRRTSARAVGVAVGRNPVSIMVPCHRVVGANGALTGYAGGVDKKISLLRLEGITVDEAAGRVVLP